MSDSDLQRWKKRLLEIRTEIVNEGDIEIEPARKDATDIKEDEDAAPYTEMNQVIASKRNRERAQTLKRVESALRRLEEKPEMFGLCRECEEPIGKRLELMPYVELCVDCQGGEDAGKRGERRRHVFDYK